MKTSYEYTKRHRRGDHGDLDTVLAVVAAAGDGLERATMMGQVTRGGIVVDDQIEPWYSLLVAILRRAVRDAKAGDPFAIWWLWDGWPELAQAHGIPRPRHLAN